MHLPVGWRLLDTLHPQTRPLPPLKTPVGECASDPFFSNPAWFLCQCPEANSAALEAGAEGAQEAQEERGEPAPEGVQIPGTDVYTGELPQLRA